MNTPTFLFRCLCRRRCLLPVAFVALVLTWLVVKQGKDQVEAEVRDPGLASARAQTGETPGLSHWRAPTGAFRAARRSVLLPTRLRRLSLARRPCRWSRRWWAA